MAEEAQKGAFEQQGSELLPQSVPLGRHVFEHTVPEQVPEQHWVGALHDWPFAVQAASHSPRAFRTRPTQQSALVEAVPPWGMQVARQVQSCPAVVAPHVGALVQQGCDYLTDELIGIDLHTGRVLPFPKPLELDETSCGVLGISPDHLPNVLASELRRDVTLVTTPVGPVDAVILPTYRAGAERETTRLNVEAAAKALLNQTMNMRRVREPGLRAVCDFAAATPVTRVVHGDSVALAAAILAGEEPI